MRMNEAEVVETAINYPDVGSDVIDSSVSIDHGHLCTAGHWAHHSSIQVNLGPHNIDTNIYV